MSISTLGTLSPPAPESNVDTTHTGLRFLLCVVGVELVLIGVLIRHSFFYADDVLSFIEAHQLGFSRKLITLNVYGHVAPFERLSHLLIDDLSPMNYHLGMAVIVILWGVLLLSLVWVLNELRVPWPVSAVLLFFVGLSAVGVNNALYYGQVVFLVPATAFVLVVTALYLRWNRTGQFRFLIGSWVAFGLSFITQERPIVALPYILVLRYVILPRRAAPGGSRRIRSDWRIWLPYAAIGVAYVRYYDKVQPHSHTTTAQLISFTRISVEDFLRVLIGLPIAGNPAWLSVLGLIGLLVLGVWFVRAASQRSHLWGAAAFALMTIEVNLYPVFRGVGGIVGVLGVTNQFQYYLDPLFGFAIAVGLAFSPIVVGTPPFLGLTARSRPPLSRPVDAARRTRAFSRRHTLAPASRLTLLAIALVGVHGAALAYSLPKVFAANQNQVAAASWSRNLNASLARIREIPGHATIVPLLLPGFYVPAFETPFNREDLYFDLLPDYHKFDTGPVQIVGPYGTLESILATDAVSLNPGGTDKAAFNFVNMSVQPSSPGTICAVGAHGEGDIQITLPTVVGHVGSGETVVMDVAISADAKANVVPFSNLKGVPKFSPVALTISPGDRRVIVAAPGQAASQVGFVHLPPHVRFCLSSAEVGVLSYPAGSGVACRAADATGWPTIDEPCGRPWN